MDWKSRTCYVNIWVLDMGGSWFDAETFNEYMDYVGNDSEETLINSIDPMDFRCLYSQFASFLERTRVLMGVSTVLLLIIIGISIFGRVKENYKWLILNQALWDLLTLFSTYCFDTSNYLTSSILAPPWACLNEESPFQAYIIELFAERATETGGFSNNAYSALLLLSYSRFVALYYPHFYERITKKHRIFYWIFGVNFIYILNRILWQHFRRNFSEIPYHVFGNIELVKPSLTLILSLIAIVMVFIKIIKHTIKRSSMNTKSNGMYRVSIVLLLQFILNFILFILSWYTRLQFYNYLLDSLGISIPSWLDSHQSWLAKVQIFSPADPENFPTVREIRVFLEAILILIVMTGYREDLVYFIKLILIKAKDPQSSLKNTKSTISLIQTPVIKLKH